MTALAACVSGIRRVNRAPAAIAGVWCVTLLASVPLALGLRAAIAQHLGSSLEADTAAAGVNYNWMLEFSEQAGGVNRTFGPQVLGTGAVLDNLSAFFDREARPAAIVAVGLLYALAWTFLAGGLIDRFARNRRLGGSAFFQACGGFFGRLVRLALLGAIVYGWLLGSVHPWLFDPIYERLTAGLNVERSAFIVRLLLYGLFAGGLAACNLLFDYAKIRLVVEDRRSAIGALTAGGRFIAGHWRGCLAIYAIDLALLGSVLAAYALVAPGAGAAGWSMWAGFMLSQCYIVGRLWVKLVFWATEIAWFQSRLAHAGYTAAPQPGWPESAVVEQAIGIVPSEVSRTR